MIHEYETGFELLAINMFKMNLSHHVHVFLCLGSVLFIFWIGQIFVQNITFFYWLCFDCWNSGGVFFSPMISFITTKQKNRTKKKEKKKGSGYHNSLDWLRKWNVSWKGEKVANTDVRFTAEIYPLTIDFSVSSFSLDGWSQKLLISPPNSSSVVTLKLKGLDSLRYQALNIDKRGVGRDIMSLEVGWCHLIWCRSGWFWFAPKTQPDGFAPAEPVEITHADDNVSKTN